MYKVYSLHCPENGMVKYIGRTKFSLENRLRAHMGSISSYASTPLDKWKLELKKKKKFPIIRLIESVKTLSESRDREKYWIKMFNEKGYKVLNTQHNKTVTSIYMKYVYIESGSDPIIDVYKLIGK